MVQREVNALKKQIADICSEYLPKKDYGKILNELEEIEVRLYRKPSNIRAPMIAILKKYVHSIRKKRYLTEQQENENDYKRAMQAIADHEFFLAKSLLSKIEQRDMPRSLRQKIAQGRAKLEEEQKNWDMKIKARILAQQKQYEDGQRLESQGELEKAIEAYRKASALQPQSQLALIAATAAEKLQNNLTEGKENARKAEALIQQKNYGQAIEYLEKILSDARLSNTELVRNIRLPLLLATSPVAGLPCVVRGKAIGVTPCIYRYRHDVPISVDDISINHPSFKTVRKEPKFGSSGYPFQIVIHVKRQANWCFSTNKLIESPLFFARDQLFIGSHDDYLYSVDTAGREVWKLKTGYLSGIQGEMHMQGDKLYLTTLGGHLYAIRIDQQNFAESEERIVGKYHMKDATFRGGPFVYRNVVFTGGSNKAAHIFIARNNSFVIYKKLAVDSPVDSKPLMLGNALVVASRRGHVYSFNWRTGEKLWQSSRLEGEIIADPVYSNGIVYICTKPGGISAFSLGNGNLRWSRNFPGGIQAAPVVANEQLWFGARSKNIYVVNANNGVVNKIIRSNGGFSASPLIYNQILFLGGEDVQLYAISLKTRKVIWKYELQGQMFARPACDGTNIYVPVGKSVYSIWIKDILNRQ